MTPIQRTAHRIRSIAAKPTAIALAITALMAMTAHQSHAEQLYKRPCTCPEGYMVMWAGKVVCAAQGIQQGPCPTGSKYDKAMELCVAKPDDDNQCPEGTQPNNYGTLCLADRTDKTTTCPKPGSLDPNMGLCVAPCTPAEINQPTDDE